MAIIAAERAIAEELLAIEMEEDARFERELLEEQLANGMEDESLDKKQIKDLEIRIKIAKQREKEAVIKRKKASKAARKAEMKLDKYMSQGEAIADAGVEKKKKEKRKKDEKYGKRSKEVEVVSSDSAPVSPQRVDSSARKSKKK